MATTPKAEQPWFQQAIDLMVRQGLSFRQAASDCGVALSGQELEVIFRRKSFQALLRAARHQFYQELAGDPGATKASAIGSLLVCAARLMEEESYDKAAEVYLKIAKLQGWVGADNNVNVFNGLSQADYTKIRRTLEAQQAPAPAAC